MKKYLLTVLVICMALAGCTSPASSASLIGSWTLTAYGPVNLPTPAVADAGAGIMFNEDETVTGNSGCNGFGGNYKVSGDKITFDQVVSTLIACDEARMAQEDAFHTVLTGTATYTIEGSTLTITNNDTVLVFTRASSYP